MTVTVTVTVNLKKESNMRINYKTHYILNQARKKFVAMKDSAFNMGTFTTLEEAMLACDKKNKDLLRPRK